MSYLERSIRDFDKPRQVHRLTGNHDYGSFHVENANRPGPIMIERSSYSTTNTNYGNFAVWHEPDKISLLQTPESLRRLGQQQNFRRLETTSKEIGTAYEGWDPMDTGPESDRFTLRKALLLREKELNRKARLPCYPPTISFTPAPGYYQPTAFEADAAQARRAPINPTISMSPDVPTPVTPRSNVGLDTIDERRESNTSKSNNYRSPAPNDIIIPNGRMSNPNNNTPRPSPGVLSPAMINVSRHSTHRELFVPSVTVDPSQAIRTSLI